MGLPTVALVLAENQQGIATGLDEVGVAVNLGWHTEISTAQITNALVGLLENRSLRRQASQRGRELVDGLGAKRVVEPLRT